MNPEVRERSVLTQYEKFLKEEGVLSPEKAKKIKSDYRKSLEGGEIVAKNLSKNPNDELWFDWEQVRIALSHSSHWAVKLNSEVRG